MKTKTSTPSLTPNRVKKSTIGQTTASTNQAPARRIVSGKWALRATQSMTRWLRASAAVATSISGSRTSRVVATPRPMSAAIVMYDADQPRSAAIHSAPAVPVMIATR
jgi:hypothetical protein